MALHFVRFRHLKTNTTKVLFKDVNGWRSTTGVAMTEDEWKNKGWIMENKSMGVSS